MKLREKVRVGSKTKRVYDKPPTPSARVLASPLVSAQSKAKLRATDKQLEVVALKQQIDHLVDQLGADPHRS